MKILLAEDDRHLAQGLSIVLKDNGYTVDIVFSGQDADFALKVGDYDLLILDLGLPRMDGLEVLNRMRSRGKSCPVLILTARDSLEDCVSSLDLGANDFMTKPFELPELEARIRALLRKDNWANRTQISLGDLTYDTVTRELRSGDGIVELSARELAVLELMLQRLGRIVSREQLISSVSGWDEELSHNAIGIVIHRLRKKLETFGIAVSAVRGLGYRLEVRE